MTSRYSVNAPVCPAMAKNKIRKLMHMNLITIQWQIVLLSFLPPYPWEEELGGQEQKKVKMRTVFVVLYCAHTPMDDSFTCTQSLFRYQLHPCLEFLLLWLNTVTKYNLGSKWFVSIPFNSPLLKKSNQDLTGANIKTLEECWLQACSPRFTSLISL